MFTGGFWLLFKNCFSEAKKKKTCDTGCSSFLAALMGRVTSWHFLFVLYTKHESFLCRKKKQNYSNTAYQDTNYRGRQRRPHQDQISGLKCYNILKFGLTLHFTRLIVRNVDFSKNFLCEEKHFVFFSSSGNVDGTIIFYKPG